MARKSSRDAILDATERVIARQGLACTTLEAVALEAGVSKGGLFYHFSTKKDMLMQLLERYGQRFSQLRDQISADLPDTPARLLKATIMASLDHPAKGAGKVSNLVALLDDVELREKISHMKKRLYLEVASASPCPEKVTLALLVTDGLWVTSMFNEAIIDETFKNRVVAELMSIISSFEKEM